MARRNPISPDRFSEIESAIVDIKQLRGECDRYEACGVDCTDRMAACDYLERELQKIIDIHRDGKPVPKQATVST